MINLKKILKPLFFNLLYKYSAMVAGKSKSLSIFCEPILTFCRVVFKGNQNYMHIQGCLERKH